jgi:hypothetical protein
MGRGNPFFLLVRVFGRPADRRCHDPGPPWLREIVQQTAAILKRMAVFSTTRRKMKVSELISAPATPLTR